jgi:hypothetical protein
LFWFCAAPCLWPQAKGAPGKPSDPDKLGLSCIQILQKTSQDWVAYFNAKADSAKTNGSSGTLRAIAAYEKCYVARTTFLAAALGKSGRGPLMGASGNFRDFQSALDDFSAKALAAANKQTGSTEAAYAQLYEKQFRYEFYRNYSQKNSQSHQLTPEESEQYSKAKNRFGELLGLLPDETAHAVHAAFSTIFSGAPVDDLTKLEVYRYAIFLLESPKDKPFSPPPF